MWGNANGAGEDNRNVGRTAVPLAGLPAGVPATTVNRLCGSSPDAAINASRTLEPGDADAVVAGGAESMTRAPWALPKPERAFPAGHVTAVSTTLGRRPVNPAMPKEWTVSLGECDELLQEKSSISREQQGAFAVRSHRLAARAWDEGFYAGLVLPVDGLARDEGIRPDTDPGKPAALKPSFRPDGTITAGNASPLSGGASALPLGTEAAADRIGLEPAARIAGRGVHAVEPRMFGFGNRPSRRSTPSGALSTTSSTTGPSAGRWRRPCVPPVRKSDGAAERGRGGPSGPCGTGRISGACRPGRWRRR